MPDKLSPDKEQPKKLAAARATIYIDIALANGQNLSFDVATATALRDELTMALAALNKRPPPPKTNRKKRPKKRNRDTQ